MKFKKIASSVVVILAVMVAVTGCGSNNDDYSVDSSSEDYSASDSYNYNTDEDDTEDEDSTEDTSDDCDYNDDDYNDEEESEEVKQTTELILSTVGNSGLKVSIDVEDDVATVSVVHDEVDASMLTESEIEECMIESGVYQEAEEIAELIQEAYLQGANTYMDVHLTVYDRYYHKLCKVDC